MALVFFPEGIIKLLFSRLRLDSIISEESKNSAQQEFIEIFVP